MDKDKYKITKELFSNVMKVKTDKPYYNKKDGKNDICAYHKDSTKCESVNVVELGNNCKLWAIEQGYVVIEYPLVVKVYKDSKQEVEYEVSDKTTSKFCQNRVFEACEWILKNPVIK